MPWPYFTRWPGRMANSNVSGASNNRTIVDPRLKSPKRSPLPSWTVLLSGSESDVKGSSAKWPHGHAVWAFVVSVWNRYVIGSENVALNGDVPSDAARGNGNEVHLFSILYHQSHFLTSRLFHFTNSHLNYITSTLHVQYETCKFLASCSQSRLHETAISSERHWAIISVWKAHHRFLMNCCSSNWRQNKCEEAASKSQTFLPPYNS